jgi:hypothetical protein
VAGYSIRAYVLLELLVPQEFGRGDTSSTSAAFG